MKKNNYTKNKKALEGFDDFKINQFMDSISQIEFNHRSHDDTVKKSSIDDLINKIKELEDKYKKVDKMTESYGTVKDVLEEFSVLRHKITDFDNKIDKTKHDTIASLGLFVALFTYISTSINIFSNVSTIGEAILLMIGMVFCLILLMLVFFVFLYRNKNWFYAIIGFVSTCILIGIAIYFINVDFNKKSIHSINNSDGKSLKQKVNVETHQGGRTYRFKEEK